MKRLYINPLPVRLWHWANALCVIVLILTGVQIRFIGQVNLLMSFRTAVTLHNIAGFALGGLFLLWLGYYLFSDRTSVYHTDPDRQRFFRDAYRQIQYYSVGILRGDPNPHHVTPYRKFNPLQSMTYQMVMLVLMPLQFFSGLLLWDVKRFEPVVELLGGVRVVDTVHVLLFVAFSAFVVMHAYMGSLGNKPSTHYKEMWTGYEELDEPADATAPRG